MSVSAGEVLPALEALDVARIPTVVSNGAMILRVDPVNTY